MYFLCFVRLGCMLRSLNTFVDDVASFLIDMPLMHRLSCFRDGAYTRMNKQQTRRKLHACIAYLFVFLFIYNLNAAACIPSASSDIIYTRNGCMHACMNACRNNKAYTGNACMHAFL